MSQAQTLLRTKVCGLTRPKDALHARELGVSALGVVHVSRSPRCATLEQARQVFATGPGLAKVLVLCDASPTQALDWAQQCGADHLQLCGNEAPQDWGNCPLTILRRVGVDDRAAKEVQAWRPLAKAFVLDHPSSPGGSGKTVDFALARELAQSAPCLLAGGLNPLNVAHAIQEVSPMGVDASSGLESSPGIKDHAKISSYLQSALASFSVN